MTIKPWIAASRPRTLPLSLACIGMGTFLAAYQGKFDMVIFVFCILTTVFLQILSNLSNDYGDSIHGADSDHRLGPSRMVQTGAISLKAMKNAIRLVTGMALISGLCLLWFSFGWSPEILIIFLIMGILSIIAAITYTSGKRPYGYVGLGDISVMIFFGIIGVGGTYFLFTKEIVPSVLLPALSCGFFSVAVLNINNIRDIESDRQAGKKSVPVRIGRKQAIVYHWMLLFGGLLSASIFVILNYETSIQFLFLVSVPLIVINGLAVRKYNDPKKLDPYLRQMALATLLFVISFGLGLILS